MSCTSINAHELDAIRRQYAQDLELAARVEEAGSASRVHRESDEPADRALSGWGQAGATESERWALLQRRLTELTAEKERTRESRDRVEHGNGVALGAGTGIVYGVAAPSIVPLLRALIGGGEALLRRKVSAAQAATSRHDLASLEQAEQDIDGKIAILEAELERLRMARAVTHAEPGSILELSEVIGTGIPARAVLERAWTCAARRFEQRTLHELQLGPDADYQDLLRDQVIEWEGLLRDLFMGEVNLLVDPVLAKLRPEPRALMEEHLVSGMGHTLFIIEIWLTGLRRQIALRDPCVISWVNRTFLSTTQRHEGEYIETSRALQRGRGGLATFAGNMRREYRNKAAHGDLHRWDLATYGRWCDFAYGTGSLHQWLDTGVSPELYEPEHFGWASFLAFARKPAPAGGADQVR